VAPLAGTAKDQAVQRLHANIRKCEEMPFARNQLSRYGFSRGRTKLKPTDNISAHVAYASFPNLVAL
jgi:hypothetical protein